MINLVCLLGRVCRSAVAKSTAFRRLSLLAAKKTDFLPAELWTADSLG